MCLSLSLFGCMRDSHRVRRFKRAHIYIRIQLRHFYPLPSLIQHSLFDSFQQQHLATHTHTHIHNSHSSRERKRYGQEAIDTYESEKVHFVNIIQTYIRMCVCMYTSESSSIKVIFASAQKRHTYIYV